MVFSVKCYVVFHFLMFYFQQVCMFKIVQLSLGNRVATILGKSCQLCLPSVHFCGCLIVFFCLFLCCCGLNVDLTVSVPDFTYSLCLK